jgi:hypothetical protein
MKTAITRVLAAAAIALASLCVSHGQAHADDPCDGITDPADRQACIDSSIPDNPLRTAQGDCQASPAYGALGQFCRN